jgi:hypothetical protein
VRVADVDQARVFVVRGGARLLDRLDLQAGLEEADEGVELLGLYEVFAGRGGRDRAGERKLAGLAPVFHLGRPLLQTGHPEEVLPDGAALPGGGVEESLVVLEVERLDHTAQEALAREVLELGVEVGRVGRLRVDDDGGAVLTRARGGVGLEVHLHARLRRVDVRLLRDVDGRARRGDQRQTDDQPEVLAHRAQVLAEVVLVRALHVAVAGVGAVGGERRGRGRCGLRPLEVVRLREREGLNVDFLH